MINLISKFLILALTLLTFGVSPTVAEDIKDKKIQQLEALLGTYIEEIKGLKAKIATLETSEKLINENIVKPFKSSTCGTDYNQCAPKELCALATYKVDGQVKWKKGLRKAWATEAKNRNLSCGVTTAQAPTKKLVAKSSEAVGSCEANYNQCAPKELCSIATTRVIGAQRAWKCGTFQKFVDEAKKRSLSCGVMDLKSKAERNQ